MRNYLLFSVAAAALILPAAANAQSTGSTEFDEGEIVVTGTNVTSVGGVEIPSSPKAKVVLDKEIIQRQRPGQSVNEIINLVPGVSFTNNDPWGSSGGSFTIRGFDSARISQTFDGIPLNDSGNYAIYTNQQLDPELIETVNVNLGSTDVDSPTAAAVGGTVNINSITPSDQLSAMFSASYGDIVAKGSGHRPYHRVFGLIQTGDLTGAGTKAWISASRAYNEATFSDYGKIDKQQYNAKIYQELGANGDFISLAGHYNVNRNNFGGSPFRANAVAGDKNARFYKVANGAVCNTDTPQTGVVDRPNNCGSDFERRYNPSNTGNVRLNSRFSLSDKLTLTVDGSYQHVKANGGGTSVALERTHATGATGVIFATVPAFGSSGSSYYFANRDLNGDGDLLDGVRVVSPSQTQTTRWGAIVNLAYELNDANRIRLSYSFDRARHRQTGQAGFLTVGGEPFDVFPVNDPIGDNGGNVLNKRNRKSFATLHQIAGEYRGSFLADALVVQIGGRLPFFERDLNQYCYTTSASGFVDCIANPATAAAYAAANPYVINPTTGRPTGSAPPQSRKYDYNKFLPNVGLTYNFTQALSLAGNYAKNLSVPGTDTLYNSLYVPADNPAAKPVAETSDSFDLSLRYKSGKVQAALTGWYSNYQNRIVSAYNIDCDCNVDTNLGEVKKYGFDASISIRPIPEVLVYLFGSYIKSEIQENVRTATGELPTAGKRERGAPEYLWGGRIQGTLGSFDLGAQIKRTGSRFLNDINSFKFDGYTVVDLDVRYSLADAGLSNTYFQLNVSNLFDEYYVGSFSGGLDQAPGSSSSFVNFGAPRAISASLIVGF
ncbi:TonB-dependent receptor [Sphingomonas koreensis]|uniref:TonB-dependent receptor n=1 Tax=Sphingomonas koreensis TaxID=93064 RepID=UPI00082D3781|nr:TonB-dependent receptor [Sphingomonas koreensis]PJI90439.1 iron complex outermembrane receptor protein [Sphingomonas koreensis]RSU61099.1 TonB-dependent receptor [Sphingomonas koreensis]RSU69744.1 TonB-dependent receptor [Sphingomonas koreensis]